MAQTPGAGVMSTTVDIGGITVTIRRSEERRTLGLTVERDGSVVATAPALAAESEILRHLRSRELWLHKSVAKRTPPAVPETAAKQFVTGEGFHYLGRSYRLRVMKPAEALPGTPPLRLHHSRFLLRHDAVNQARAHFIHWYSAAGQRWLGQHLPTLAQRVGVIPMRTRVRDLGFRWASCSDKGCLNFHWRTFLLPPVIIRYLAMHELCHLIEHHHGPAFWRTVSAAQPDWQAKERWLREHAHGLSF
jgi:hypothetical protein